MTDTTTNDYFNKIAIVGLSGRYPGAENLEGFWANLVAGKNSITYFSEEELIEAGVPKELAASSSYVGAGGIYERPFDFDASFFGYTPREAEVMDPQHRIFLEHSWHALEHAGYDSLRYDGRIGVFGGTGITTYLFKILKDPALSRALDPYAVMTNNDRDYLATRVGHKLDLRGPCVAVQTACSTSLVAISLGAQSLLTYQTDMVLAGGVSLDAEAPPGYNYMEGSINSPDGVVRTFDSSAKGTVWAAGVGVVVLKRLEDAIADRDTIHAVMIGYGLSNDGASRAGFTAPGVEGQVLAARDALLMADAAPETIDYIECHGTGTLIGDPIEVTALARAYGGQADMPGRCALASVKTNIGHADAAAGAAGFIKAVFALRHRQIPASLNFSTPNPQIDFERSPFYVNTTLQDWVGGHSPRRVAVNSFGMGGTNAHVILEEAPPSTSGQSLRTSQLLLLSARTESALTRMAANLSEHLHQHPEAELADTAYTLQVGRRRFAQRMAFVAHDRDELSAAHSDAGVTGALVLRSDRYVAQVSFMFPGQGSQYPNMSRALYETEPLFRSVVDECCEKLTPLLGRSLLAIIYPVNGQEEAAALELAQTRYTQPALFVIEYALARLWMAWGIQPAAMIGHSVGEYVAACLASVISLDDALNLIALRGRLIQDLPTGAMVGVLASASLIEPILRTMPTLSIAAINTPDTCVVSGSHEEVAQFEINMAAMQVPCARLKTSHAFHSAMMEPACAAFREIVAAVRLQPPELPYLSNVTGTWITAQQATDPTYWVDHLRQPVLFSNGVEVLFSEPDTILLEVGPGTTLTALANQHPAKGPALTVVSSLPSAKNATKDARDALLMALGRLWCEGATPDWEAIHAPETRTRVPAPTYPFEHQSYRLTFDASAGAGRDVKSISEEKRKEIAEWFTVPTWTGTAPLTSVTSVAGLNWLVFVDQSGLGQGLVQGLAARGYKVVTVTPGNEFQRLNEHEFTLRPGEKDDYATLMKALRSTSQTPDEILHLWALSAHSQGALSMTGLDAGLDTSFFSVLFLSAALGSELTGVPVKMHAVTSNAHNVLGDEPVEPVHATVAGPIRSLSREQKTVQSHWIDIHLPEAGDHTRLQRLSQDVLAECLNGCEQEVIAYRNGRRWLQDFAALPVGPADRSALPLRDGGVYMIAGGLGAIGLTLAKFIAEQVRARLVLVSRTGLPPRDEWHNWLQRRGEHNRDSKRMRQVMALEELGAKVLVLAADVSNMESMTAAVAVARETFGPIEGAINASGVPGVGMMELKNREVASRVLAPKIKGTIVLDATLKDDPLGFFISCSSLLAVLGEVGQSDYAAANSFIGAFVSSNRHQTRVAPVSIDYDRWDEIGMAVNPDASIPEANHAVAYEEVDHPLFDARFVDENDEVFVVHLDARKHWLVAEHHLGGQPAMVGTGYVQFAYSAYMYRRNPASVQIHDLVFTGALMLAATERRELQVRLTHTGNHAKFAIRSLLPAGGWMVHATGTISTQRDETGGRHDLVALREKCPTDFYLGAEGNLANLMEDHPLVKVGERWNSVRAITHGADTALAALALPPNYHADLGDYGVHPALLDVATAFPVQFASKGGSYLPFGYNRIHLYRALPAEVVSYARFVPARSATDEFLSFDLSILDTDGSECIRIEGYGMKLVRNVAAPALELQQFGPRSAALPGADRQLTSEDGVEVFRRVLSLSGVSRVETSTREIHYLLQESADTRNSVANAADSVPADKGARYPRPSLATPYVAPRTPLEESIAQIWQDVLGLDQIGVCDDFIDLGGHSLFAIQLTSRIRQQFEIELSVATFYSNPTVEGIAATIVGTLVDDLDEDTLKRALEDINT
jgi:phthiocerol/phenolphthiocerol synthesis type-I polyketide synthase E